MTHEYSHGLCLFIFFYQSWMCSSACVVVSFRSVFVQPGVRPDWRYTFPVITAQSQPSRTAPTSLRTDRPECCASCCFGGPALRRDSSIEETVEHLVNLHIPCFVFLWAPEIPSNVTMAPRAKFHTLPPRCPPCLAERVSLFNIYSASFLLFT